MCWLCSRSTNGRRARLRHAAVASPAALAPMITVSLSVSSMSAAEYVLQKGEQRRPGLLVRLGVVGQSSHPGLVGVGVGEGVLGAWITDDLELGARLGHFLAKSVHLLRRK